MAHSFQLGGSDGLFDLPVTHPDGFAAGWTRIIALKLGNEDSVPGSEALEESELDQDLTDRLHIARGEIGLGDVFSDIRDSGVLADVYNIAAKTAADDFPGEVEPMPVDPSGPAEDVKVRMPESRVAFDLDDSGTAVDVFTPDLALAKFPE
jgi:hypothetical protein